MPRRYCGSCRGDLHADDGHSQCVSCLGKSHADAALAGSDCSHCESISLASLRTRIAFFSESDPAPRPSRFLPLRDLWGKTAGQRFSAPGWERAHAGSDPACLVFTTQRDFSRPFCPTWPASLRKRERSGLVWGKWRWAGRWQHVTGSFRCWGAVGLSGLTPPPLRFARAQRRQSRDGCRLFRVLSKAVWRAGFGVVSTRGGPLAAVWMSGFCQGAVRPLNNDHRRSSLKYTTSSRDLGALLTLPASVLPLNLPSLRLMALKKRDMRGCPQLDESVAAHLCPPTCQSLEGESQSPSKPCRITSALAGRSYASAGQAASALHSMAVLQGLSGQAPLCRRRVWAWSCDSQGAEKRNRPSFASHQDLPPKP